MAVPVESVTRADVDQVRYDELDFDTENGRVLAKVFMPSVRQVDIQGAPDIIVPYSAGWGEGRGAAEVACQALARAGDFMAVAIEYPRKNLAIHDIVPFRSQVLSDLIVHIKEQTEYDRLQLVMIGYSRGTAPARRAATQQARYIEGLSLIAPTWFREVVRPRELAQKGLAESARGIMRESWVDKWGLIAAGARLAQEMVTHPIALRNDVASISEEGAADLEQVLTSGVRVGVISGLKDELCEVEGIRQVLGQLSQRMTVDYREVDYREVDSDHFYYFLKSTSLRVIAEQVTRLAG